MDLATERILPVDSDRATLIGRAWVPGPLPGPSPVILHAGQAHDVSLATPTVADLLNADDPVRMARAALANGRA